MSPATNILALDQGTTSTRAIVFDGDGQPVSSSQIDLKQSYPKPGWVEHDPDAIAAAAIAAARTAVKSAGLDFTDITCIGITNQRETTVVWDRETGRPVANAIVWQCRRTFEACRQLADAGYERDIRQTTGLVLDPYFSATKIRWLLDWLPNGQRMAENGELCFGTVDTWLLHRLTAGAIHATDATNASRTMLLNLHDLQWDPDLLSLFDIPEAMLPEVRPSVGEFGVTDPSVFGTEIPITGVAGDQHAALYGQACHEQGMAKTTYGTGAFVLSNAGSSAPLSPNGLLATLGWQIGARRTYALEGSIFIAGAAIQWLRDELGVLASAEQSDGIADSVEDNDGVYFVPAFTGLGSPHWEPEARGSISGITRGTTRAHIVRAALEATAYQVRDVVEAIDASGRRRGSTHTMRADGGQTANRFLMQFQADILDRPIEVSAIAETTALGAAFLAGRGYGVWDSDYEIADLWRSAARYEPAMPSSRRDSLYAGWREALRHTI